MRVAAIVCVALLAAACVSATMQPERPAFIVNTTVDSRAELLSAVRAALNNASVLLADDALTDASVLSIDRRQRLDGNGLPMDGRQLGTPDRFLLSTDGKRCLLRHERTQQQWTLQKTQCVARLTD